ncbi:hypothetical protein [Thermus phage TSP4]|nr:hypothetical protein [Thermus phage TSP4]
MMLVNLDHSEHLGLYIKLLYHFLPQLEELVADSAYSEYRHHPRFAFLGTFTHQDKTYEVYCILTRKREGLDLSFSLVDSMSLTEEEEELAP